MSIPKKGSRKIVVNGIEYRWRVRWKPNYGEAGGIWNLNAVAELYENPQSTLLINFPWIPKKEFWDWYEVNHIITPKIIETCIKAALDHGWEPFEKGNAFKINHEN